MNSKWTGKDFGITAGISLVYFMITMVVMMSGALTPILWIFMPALIGFFTGIPYLYIVAKEAKPGVVFLMNLIVGVIYFIAGELSNLVIVTLIITTVLAEGVRKVGGYHNLKTTLFSLSYFPLVCSVILSISGCSPNTRLHAPQRKCRPNMRQSCRMLRRYGCCRL